MMILRRLAAGIAGLAVFLSACTQEPLPAPIDTQTAPPPSSAAPGTAKPLPTAVLVTPVPTDAVSSSTLAPPTATPTSTPTPAPSFSPLLQAPRGDPLEVTARLRYKRQTPLPTLPFQPTEYPEGRQDTFNVLDLGRNQVFSVQAVIRKVTANVYLYVEVGRNVAQAEIDATARELEEKIIPAVKRYANPDWQPGAGIDSRLTVLNANVPQVGGYYSFTDQLPIEANKFSNQRPMVLINLAVLRPATPSYYEVVTHELQHAAQAQADMYEDTWVQEGASEYVAELAGYPANLYPAFIGRTDVQLTSWEEDQSTLAAHYGAAHLFFKYLARRFGTDAVATLISGKGIGVEGVDAFLRGHGVTHGFDQAYTDWITALFQDPTLRNALPLSMAATLATIGRQEGEVRQYGVDYIRVNAQSTATTLTFTAPSSVGLLPIEGGNGPFWHSNRGDSIDTTLTRDFDLTGLATATLTFKLWYDIERDYDYAYVMASQDAGKTWEILRGPHSTTDNPLDQSYGPAYNGKSGGGRAARWVDEQIDLAPFAGRQIQLRFEYITDSGQNFGGLALDDIAIPELSFRDGAETPGTWRSSGFLRTDNKLPQAFLVRFLAEGQEPRTITLDAQNQGQLGLAAGTAGTLIISAQAPLTNVPVRYTLDLQAVP